MHTIQIIVRSASALALLLFGLMPQAATDRLVITGSSTMAPLAAEIAKRFEKQNPGIRVDVQSGGSSRGVADARSGLANIGMASRSLKDGEKDLMAHTIAMDGIGIILHKSNSISVLLDEQIKAIYRGQIKNWKEVGGKDLAITVVNKAEGRSTLELFLHYTGLKNSEIKARGIPERRWPVGRSQRPAGQPGAGALGWTAAALVHRPRTGAGTRSVADGRALQCAGPDLLKGSRGTDWSLAWPPDGGDRHPQSGAGAAPRQLRRLANYAAFFWMTERVGKLIEFGQCISLFDAPQSALTHAYVTGAAG